MKFYLSFWKLLSETVKYVCLCKRELTLKLCSSLTWHQSVFKILQMLILRNGSHEKSLKLPHPEILPLIHFLFCKGKVLFRKSYRTTPFTTIKNDPCKKWLDVHAETYTYQYCSFWWTLFKNCSLKVSGIDKSSDI